MDEINIDSESANIIVIIYARIKALNHLLETNSSLQSHETSKIGKELKHLMDLAMLETSFLAWSTKLIKLDTSLDSILKSPSNTYLLDNLQEVNHLLLQIKENIAQLQSKYNV